VIVGIGVDLVDIPRFERSIARTPTVTDFARFRGWSTSRPFAVARPIAKMCSGTTASRRR
jgi:phosphopantetheinyl transferase (holo-ACP synthase)